MTEETKPIVWEEGDTEANSRGYCGDRIFFRRTTESYQSLRGIERTVPLDLKHLNALEQRVVELTTALEKIANYVYVTRGRSVTHCGTIAVDTLALYRNPAPEGEM